ncbi:hypothetical protein Tco_0262382 [Tanacetum coccineum]
MCAFVSVVQERIIKTKVSKNESKPTRNEETSTRVKNESQSQKSDQSKTRRKLMKVKGLKLSKVESLFIKRKKKNGTTRTRSEKFESYFILQIDAYAIGDQFINDKSIDDEPGKLNVEAEVVSIVTVPIYQASSSVPPLSTLTERIAALEKKLSDLEQTNKNLDNTTRNLGYRVYTLELRDLPHKINEAVRENVKEDVQIALQPPLRDRFRDLAEEDMKEMLHQRMFESGTYKSLPEHTLSMKHWRHLCHELKGIDSLLKRTSYASDAVILQPVKDIPIPDSANISDSEETGSAHLPHVKPRPAWLKPIPEEDRPATIEPAWKMGKTELTQADLEGQAYEVVKAFYPNVVHLRKGSGQALLISKMKAARYHDFGLELLVPEHMWIDDVCTYNISASYGISHWWFNRQKFYIDRHTAESSRKVVRTHMHILSVVSIKAYSRYGYDYLKEITLRRANHQDYTTAEKDFKNLYPSDFEDLNLFLLQGHLNHLPDS